MRVHPDWLAGLLAAMERDPSIACAGSMVMDWEGRTVEYAGRFDDVFSLAYEPLAQSLRPENSADAYTLFVSGGAMLLEREVFLSIGGFDERYFMYHEDVDLCWRLWLAGRRCCIAPRSVVYHRGGASSGKLARGVVSGWGQQHLLWTVLKNLDGKQLQTMLPLLVYFLVERGRWSEESLKALLDNFEAMLAGLSSILSSRHSIQAGRRASDADIFAQCGHPFAFILRSPLFRRASVELASSGTAPDWSDPGAVARAFEAWLARSLELRDAHAADWQADATEKYLRVVAFAERSGGGNPLARMVEALSEAPEPDPYADWPDVETRLRRRLES
jgi:cellulose synthase/poly-beta-1,6-N-acetylglucosamine synthase-like glycosyltransferase